MAPTTQKALVVTEVGQPLVLVTERAVPQPGPNQIQIKVTVAGLNPHDQKARDMGLFITGHLPAVLTNDVVGRVSQLGDGVTGVAIGDRVVAHAAIDAPWLQTGLQEYTLAYAGCWAKLPDSVSDDEAATLPTNIIAPLVALFHLLRLRAPWDADAASANASATLLVVGGGSNCGRFGVQLAKLAGVGRIVVVGGDEAELRRLGATHVLDRHGGYDAVLARIRAVVGDDLVFAFDAVNPNEGQLLALNALSSHKRGALARLVPLGPVDETRVLNKTAGFEVRNVHGMSHAFPDLAAPFWERVPGYLEAGKITPLGFVVKEGLMPENVNVVLDAYRDGKRVTKTHVHL
ncbi:Uu.00g069120.m01.CDS01 [Anthostomella pinea]|uniref:Uu.00g069120.m01.CDS01 n=1 Tax=Anthostomella pinea TaxID=933095 RepID=A0AAI8VUF4_9PEZI|nr:Uu.00g069120.m01.CDS01 [Anthostomella pinea]